MKEKWRERKGREMEGNKGREIARKRKGVKER